MTTDDAVLRVLRCRSSRLEWAVADTVVRRVVPVPGMTRIPGAPPTVAGLGNFGGELLPLVDSRRLLGEPGDTPLSVAVVVEVGGHLVALGVDAVDDIVSVPMEAFQVAVGSAGVPADAVIAEGRTDRPFLLLDLDVLLAPVFRARSGKA